MLGLLFIYALIAIGVIAVALHGRARLGSFREWWNEVEGE